MVVETERKNRARLSIKLPDKGTYTLISPTDITGTDSVGFDRAAARTACALSFSAQDDTALRENLTALGYRDLVFFDDTDKRGGSAFCIAGRARSNRFETAVVIQSTKGNEWYSNFDIGYTAEHSGFSRAADFIELKVGDYLFTRAIGMEPEFFVTGYSRGGAVAGILAKRLSERYGTDSVRAYTFASPRVTISRHVTRYNCIFNLVRDEDIITRIPPESWGYLRYGKDITLRTGPDFADRFSRISEREYIGFDSSEPIDSILCAVTKLSPNVHAYYERRRRVGDRSLSLYGFMTSVADLLSSDQTDESADILISAMLSDYADLLSFLSKGADLSELISSAQAAPRCSAADSHSPEAYIAALECGLL